MLTYATPDRTLRKTIERPLKTFAQIHFDVTVTTELEIMGLMNILRIIP